MAADHLIGIEQFETDLWDVADNLRANSNLASNEHFLPILGLIFLRQASNRHNAAMAAINEDIASGAMPDRGLIEADFTGETLRSIHAELAGLNEEAAELAARIAKNFEELGV